MNITQILSQELSATAAQITAAIELLDKKAVEIKNKIKNIFEK